MTIQIRSSATRPPPPTTGPSSGPGTRTAIQLPTVQLDTTLTDLFRRARPADAHKRLAYLHTPAHCAVSLGPHVRRNTTYLYQDGSFVQTPRRDLTARNRALRRALAVRLLDVVPQRDAFITGPSAAVLFHDARAEPREARRARAEAEATLAVLGDAQRPELVQCPGPCSVPMAEAGFDLIAGYKTALDGLLVGEGEGEGRDEKYPLAVGLDKHWFLNSKRALALSGLPTPPTEVVEVTGCAPVPAGECCEVCRREESSSSGVGMIPTIPADCEGPRGRWYREREGHILSAVERRPVPFAFKTQQTFGGGGTWIVDSACEKRELLRHLADEDGVVRKLLPQLSRANQHLRPGSMMLSELVQEQVANYGVTFCVTDAGGVVFMGVSEQLLAGDGKAWTGSVISYDGQEELQARLGGLMEQTAQWLSREHHYSGPVGMDVLEASVPDGQGGASTEGEKKKKKKKDTAFFIVDLNVRTSGSMSLPLLRGHFTSRGLDCAGMCTITTRHSRWEFIDQWRSEFEAGDMIIISWYEDVSSQVSAGCVIMGARDRTLLEERIEALKASTDEVTF